MVFYICFMLPFVKKNLKLTFLIIFSFVFLLTILYNCTHPEKPESLARNNPRTLKGQKAVYVGRQSCKRCHEKEYALFSGSDHDRAMDIADSTTVLGNFNNTSFTHFGVTSRFFREENQYYVYTEGEKGVMKKFKIKYVFGYYPLQQYLIEFPGGRYQCLPICWDCRPKSQGGQRWFHIYNNEKIRPNDVLYWTGIMQNWNHMCAECHSTDLKKNYDYKNQSYHTSWTEIDVSCEACHGPASLHLLWAEAKEKGTPPELPHKGFAMSFTDSSKGTWVIPKGAFIAVRTTKWDSHKLLETCARCHSRRGTISYNYTYGKSLLDTHSPALLDENLYYPDGQIEDEDYEYDSFLQSKMYKAGVFCTDCHDPHSTKVLVLGNALCYRCHSAEKYGSKNHHFHKAGSAGAQCMSCHMPARKYMVVDTRYDHSFRIPRPDLSLKLGTPNACNQCHKDKSVQWAYNAFRKWYGDPAKYGTHYGEIIAGARKASPYERRALEQLTSDTSTASIVRATALSLLKNYSNPDIISSIEKGLDDRDPLIRYGALLSANLLPAPEKSEYLTRLLNDTIRLIRINAAALLSESGIKPEFQAGVDLLGKVSGEYEQSQLVNADFPSSWLNLGLMYSGEHQDSKAEDAYRRAIALGPSLPYGYINLADLYRKEGRDNQGELVLNEGLNANPEMAGVHQALGLLLVRKGDHTSALQQFETAFKLDPENTQFGYTYGIALYSIGLYGKAIDILEAALKSSPYSKQLLYALTTINRDQGNREKALTYANLLLKYYPENQDYLALKKSLQPN